MSTADMLKQNPNVKARMAGVFYLFTFLTGGVAAFSGKLIVHDDAAATAASILAHQPLYWLGFAAYLMVVACYIAVTALFYELFKPVNRSVSLVAAFFSLAGCAIQAAICVFLVAPLVLLRGAQYLSVFKMEQLRPLAYMCFELYGQGFDICFVFFGFYCLLIGYLIFKSNLLPRTLGVLMALAGLGWLTFLVPPFAHSLDPYIRAPGVLGELSLTLWLLVKGVNVDRSHSHKEEQV